MILKQKHVSDSYVPALDRRTLMTTPVSLFAGAYRLMFGCNSRSELTSATLGNAAYAYAFDYLGNRATASEAGTQLAYAANALNQYATITETEAFTPTYDADGNATSVKTATGTWSISYNGENRPVRFENTGTQTVVECGYDSLGRRFEKKVTVAGTLVLHERYAYRGYLQIAAFDVAGTQEPALKRVIYWDPTEETATRPLAVNILGDNVYFPTVELTKNICELVDFYGNAAATYDYAPFGNVSAGTPSGSAVPANPFQFSSEVYDSELDLVYYNYRHYSPSLGRFLSRDPIEEQGGLNLYAFLKNTVGSTVDRLGRAQSCSNYSKVRSCKEATCEGRTMRQAKTPEKNGCGPRIIVGKADPGDWLIPDSTVGAIGIFTEACNNHDVCFGTCGADIRRCNADFQREMATACEKEFGTFNPLRYVCIIQSYVYEIAVSSIGSFVFESAQDEHCEWECCEKSS